MSYILDINDDPFDINIFSYETDTLINYTFKNNSAGQLIPIDRGQRGDRYSSKLIFKGTTDDVYDLILILDDLRTNKKEVIIGGLSGVPIFGDNVDYSSDIKCLVVDYNEINHPVYNVVTIELTLLATGITFTGLTILPSRMQCLKSGWKTINEKGYIVNETYFRNNYLVETFNDYFEFNGEYLLDIEGAQQILNMQRINRGNTISITNLQLGTDFPWGPTITDISHNVKIKEVNVEPIGPQHRKMTLSLIREK